MQGELDDRALMQRFQDARDERAFGILFARNKGPLYRFLLQLAGNPAVAEDVSQYTWLRLIELARDRRYDSDTSAQFRTFLFTLARNRYIDEYLRKSEATLTESLVDHEAEALPDPGPGLLDSLAAEQSRTRVHRALGSLRREQREVLSLWMQGFELQEVANITGSPWDTIVARKKHALKRFAAALRSGPAVELP
jgi:RNA polymerase sigma-70 factor (ECF subfamily)